jgi:hypothetical protein
MMKKKFNKFVLWIVKMWIKLKRLFRKKKLRIYRVVASSSASMVGTNFVGTPKRGREMALVKKDKGYLTLNPISITKHNKGERYVVYGKYSKITARRIK